MLKRRIMKVFLVVGVILLIWLILAQSCMTFRVADSVAKQKFSEKGVTLITQYDCSRKASYSLCANR
jgi:hypothetical protein